MTAANGATEVGMDISSRLKTGYLVIFAAFELAAMYLLFALDGETKLVIAVPCAFTAVILSVFTAVFRKKMTAKAVSALLAAVALTAGTSLGTFLCRYESNVKRDGVRSYIGVSAVIEGEITEVVYEEDFGAMYYADISDVGGKRVSFPLKITTDGKTKLSVCDRFRCDAVFHDLVSTDYVYGDAYIEGKGIYASAVCGDLELLAPVKSIRYYSGIVNRAASEAVSEATGDGADLANALILGRRDGLSDTLKRDFRALGISHLLALSGLHFSVIVGSLSAILSLFRVRRVPKHIILLLFSLGFAFLTGFGVTVSRAAIMMIIFCLAKLIGRQADSLTSLSAAAVILTAVSPSSAYNVGFQLSFAAALGIILLSPEANLAIAHITAKQSVGETRAQKAKRRIKGILLLFPLALYIGVAATLFTLPVTAETFGAFSPLSFFFTALFSIPATVLIYSGFAVLLFSAIPFVPKIPGFLCEKLAMLIKGASSRLSGGEYIFSLNYGFLPYLFVFTAAVLLTGLLIKPKRYIHLKLFVFLAAAAFFSGSFFICRAVAEADVRDVCTVSYLNCGESEMLTVKINGHGAIIDVSTGGSEGVYAADTMLGADALPEPETLILTHYHKYHAQTVAKYCSDSFLKEIYLPAPTDAAEKELYEAVYKAADGAGLTVHIYCREKDRIDFYGAEIFMPCYGRIERSVHPVFAVASDYYGSSALYLSSAVWESDVYTNRHADGSLMIIVGSHGPKAETAFYCETPAKIYAPTRYSDRFECGFTEVPDDCRVSLDIYPPQTRKR